jgi:hypothetical protein
LRALWKNNSALLIITLMMLFLPFIIALLTGQTPGDVLGE